MNRDFLVSLFPTRHDFRSGFADLWQSLNDWPLWGMLAWRDIRQRYRRSLLGPLWLTLSMAIHVGAIGVLWSNLFGIDAENFIPHLCVGLLVWNLLTSVIQESCKTYEANSHLILQSRRPLFSYILWTIWRNLIIFVHNFVVYIIVVMIFAISPTVDLLWLVVAAPLMVLSFSWAALFLGVLAARYRDIPPIIGSIFTVMFFLTPVMWKSEQLGRYASFADLNPITHIIDLIRDPLMGHSPDNLTWLVTGLMTVIGWTLAVLFFARFRSRIAYWL